MTPATDPAEAGFDAVIVGGGAAGVLVAIHLLAGDGRAPRVAIIEPAAEPGAGAAYSTSRPEHLLNVVAARMSAIGEQSDHFVDFLARDGNATRAALADSFAQRRDYARYLRDTLAALPANEAPIHLRDRASAVERDGEGFTVHLASGTRLQARHVVLAVGNAPRPLPPFLLHPRARVVDAWDYARIAAIPGDGDVCILGSGLSMVDAALTLGRDGRRGRILALSRRALVPLPHARGAARPDADVDEWLPLGVLARLRLLRSRIAAATAAGEPWQWSFDRLRPHGQALWRSLDAVERRRFLRHAVRCWDVHRHRIAPEVATTIEAMRGDGRLEVVAGRLRAITADPAGGSCIHFRPRHEVREHMRRADWIVNASGVETNIDLHPDRLLQAMRERRLVLPGPLGIGLATDGAGHVVDGRGRADPRLFAIGALRIGDLWESIAIPELREQAREIAAAIRNG